MQFPRIGLVEVFIQGAISKHRALGVVIPTTSFILGIMISTYKYQVINFAQEDIFPHSGVFFVVEGDIFSSVFLMAGFVLVFYLFQGL